MVENNREGNSDNEQPGPSVPPLSNTKEHPDAIKSEPKTKPDTSNTDNIKHEPINVIVNIPEKNIVVNSPQQDNSIGTTANRISRFSVFVNIILIALTFLLFMKTIDSTDAAIRSAKAAEEAVAEQRLNDSINRISAKESSYYDSVNMAKRFSLDSTTWVFSSNRCRHK